MRDRAPQILVVEDGPEDFDLLQYAFRACGIHTPLIHYPKASPVVELFGNPDNVGVLLPSLLLLDLNLPDIDGRDVLVLLRASKLGKAIPIVIFTTSNNPHDVTLCYSRGANGYIVKPVGLEGLKKMAVAFKTFWLETAELPG